MSNFYNGNKTLPNVLVSNAVGVILLAAMLLVMAVALAPIIGTGSSGRLSYRNSTYSKSVFKLFG